MPGITTNLFVAAPPPVVFEAATDLRKAAGRIGGIKRLEVLTDGPIRKGTRFRETRIMFKREATEEMEITEFDPPRMYAVGCENHGCRYRSEFRFAPRDGGTDVAMTFAAEPLSVFAKVMSVQMRPMMKACLKEIAKDLDNLKVFVESGAAAAEPVGRGP